MKIVIFCGGYGTRMWPASRKSYPKQFNPLIGGRSFFQLTLARFKKEFSPEDIFVSTEDDFVTFVRKQAPELPKSNIIAEPERRDNLGAVGLATAVVNKYFPGEVMMVSWSDHLIAREKAFLRAVLAAGKYAKETGLIVSVDERPTYPSIHQGWVKLGKVLGKVDGQKVVQLIRHIEKPDEKVAERLFKTRRWLLNTGYRAWRTDLMLSYYKKFVPKMYAGLTEIAGAWGTKRQDEVLRNEYHKFEKESVEYGIFEKLPKDKRATIPVEVGWEDAGTWELFYKALITEKEKTIIEGGVDTEFINADRNLIIGRKGKVISIIGLSNIVVIDTPDALLVCRMEDTDEVKPLFKKLEAKKEKYVK
jgi:mannose-1-phosphate guanylyltransferase